MTPLVSAIIPNFNHADRLSLTLQAIEEADYSNIEVLIVDDASTDNSREVIETWVPRLPRCRAFFNRDRLGVDPSMNRLLREARGEFVYFRGSDDFDRRDFVARSVAMLVAHQNAALCCADIQNFYERPGDGFAVTSAFSKGPQYLSPDQLTDVIRQRQILGYTAVVRRERMQEIGGFDESLLWTSDLLAFLVLGFRHGICYIPEGMVHRHLDRESFSARGSRDMDRLKQVLRRFLAKLTKEYPDVCPRFMKSGWLGYFGPVLAEIVFECPELQSPTNLLLIQRNLWLWNKMADSHVEPVGAQIESVLRNHRDWLTATRGVIAVYGAGRHTEVLLEKWRLLELPAIGHFITTDEPSTRQFAGRSVYCVSEIAAPKPDLVILSSQSFENDMHRVAEKRFPSARILSIWNPALTKTESIP